ncbi:MbtH family protein [Sphaerisporangium corydalis]|uniref:MbtH family protein n=1 Tax=Sphaerisporangium corydalis TaxID=1441875 RepID=A0ABV9ESA0_9ACTN|nr:MbtH family NRPS accessory protein [Sphaerisporangium corydalis]
MSQEQSLTDFLAVVNGEAQYSIWPAGRPLPLGWAEAGMRGTEEACLAHIEEVWTDMRPASLARAMRESSGDAPTPGQAA